MSDFQEYPKCLYLNGDVNVAVVVFDADEEAEKHEEGYETTASAADASSSEDKDALIAKAKELGIKATKNWGVEKLEEAIAEAELALASQEEDAEE
jgi:hypothetical protein